MKIPLTLVGLGEGDGGFDVEWEGAGAEVVWVAGADELCEDDGVGDDEVDGDGVGEDDG